MSHIKEFCEEFVEHIGEGTVKMNKVKTSACYDS